MLENTILENVFNTTEFSSKVFLHLKRDYFQDPDNIIIYDLINDYFTTRGKTPSLKTVKIMIEESNSFTEDQYQSVKSHIADFEKESHPDQEWLVTESQEWCMDRALHLAAGELIQMLRNDKDVKLPKTSIIDTLTKALSINFDENLGIDLIRDAEEIFQFMTEPQNKIPFDLDILNKITNGGITTKTLNIILAGTHVGKCVRANTKLNIFGNKETIGILKGRLNELRNK